ncbi:MAG: hypothetical protein GON13_02910 [Nanoarchaeota archaeon]|nr:hypothetical protein [Nanoarchaeota archaeon]
MISNVIDLTLALSKAGDKAVLVTNNESVIESLKEHGSEIAKKTGVKHLIVQKQDPEGVKKNFSVNYESVEEKYGDKTVMIIGKITTLSFESIKNNIKDGVFKIEVSGEEYEIDNSFLIEEIKKPEGSEIIDFGKGYVYVEPEMDITLEDDENSTKTEDDVLE